MIYELREYVAAPGRSDALHTRFAEVTLPLFDEHGLDVAGFWTDSADDGRIVYLLRFDSAEAQEKAWAAFQGDPRWAAAKAASETDGPLAAEMHSTTLARAPYWPHETAAERS
jgi:hypothetical protein